MDVIPLDATLVKGSHGRRPTNVADYPVIIADKEPLRSNVPIHATDVYHILKRCVLG